MKQVKHSLSRSQQKLVRFLLDPRSYPHRPKSVRLVQTHGSWVFVAKPYVFKVKKPVNFGFLDFSKLERRRHFCAREVALNRRLSPHTYLGVVEIREAGSILSFGGKGRVIEYAVKMRHLVERGFLDQMLERNAVGKAELDRVVGLLARFYENQEPPTAVERWGRINRLRISTNENFRQTAGFIGSTLTPPAFAAIRAWTNQFYRRHRSLFSSRVRNRRILDCHGDLHSEHIHITPKTVSVYDCIEFNDRFRYVDIANDVAFLAMDLDFHGRPDLANYFAHRMAERLSDPDLLRLIDFYKCYRAYVRGKVESLHGQTSGADESEREKSSRGAADYFRLALRYAVAGSMPVVLIVMGRIASGKSTLAQHLGGELGWPVFSSDEQRKSLAGVPKYQRVSPAARQRLYSERMSSRTYRALLRNALAVVRSGSGVIVDATFSRRDLRAAWVGKLRQYGIPFCFVEVRASNRTIKQRLRARARQSHEVSDARLEDFETLTWRYEPPVDLAASECVKLSAASRGNILTESLKKLVRLHVG